MDLSGLDGPAKPVDRSVSAMFVIYRLWLPASVIVLSAVIGYAANLFVVFGHPSISRDLRTAIGSEYGLIEVAKAVK